MDEGLTCIVKGYRDRIQRNGGSVSVDAAGTVYLRAGTGQGISLIDQGGSTRLSVASGGTVTTNGNHTVTGTLTVSGTGTHTFGGPVSVASLITSNRAADFAWFDGLQAGAKRFRLHGSSNGDTVLYSYAGAAGSEVATESLRIVNSNGYVSVATRFGVKTAAPGYEAEIVGDAYVTAKLGVGVVPTTGSRFRADANGVGTIAGVFTNSAAGATSPVMVVKGGATPGAGGDLAQFQVASGTLAAAVKDDGKIYSRVGFQWLVSLSQATVGAAGGASALPATPSGYLPIYTSDGLKYVIPYFAAA